jgi:hypothetical protein
MSFRNPFIRIKNWDDSAYIRVNVGRFSELENKPHQFYEAIKTLALIRESLAVIQQANMLSSVANGFKSYKMAIDWLKLNNHISTGIVVSAITSYDDINDSIAASFSQFVSWFKSNYLDAVQQYQNTQLAIGAAKADKMRSLALQAEEYSKGLDDETTKLKDEIESLTNDKLTQLASTLGDLLNQHMSTIQNAGNNAIASIEQAQALTIWHEAYQQNITEYETKLNGAKWKPLEFRNRIFVNRKLRRVGINNSEERRLSKWAKYYLLYVPSRSLRFFATLLWRTVYWLLRKIFSLSGRRIIWFVALGIVTCAQSVMLLALLLNGRAPDIPFADIISGNGIANLISSDYIIAKISIYIGFIVVPSLGYSFANKNYRIYSNLLDQYKQRATVAQTLQGILRNIDETDRNKDIRVNLVSVAAVAMFEMKNIGHLTKHDNDSSIIDKLAASLTGGKSG